MALVAAATCTAAALAAFACGTTGDQAGVRCGPGTVETNLECVPAPPTDAAIDDAPASPQDAAREAETDAASDADAGPPVHNGDTCTQPGCYANRLYACQYASVDAAAGTVIFEEFGDCSLLGGTCTVGAPLPACKGGGYTSCNPADAGTHCASSDLVVICDTEGRGTWMAASCATIGAGYVCTSGAAGAGCGPP